MTVTSKWVALHEVSDYLAKGWREVQIKRGRIGCVDKAALMVSPEEPASEPAKVEPATAISPHGVWRCECCAEIADPMDPRFRWNGECWQHHHAEAQTHFDCRFFGPQPEPVAAEMGDDEVAGRASAAYRLRWEGKLAGSLEDAAQAAYFDGFVAGQRTHTVQPAPAVAMTPALEKVLESAELAGKHYDDWSLLSAVVAVRQEVTQAAEAGKGSRKILSEALVASQLRVEQLEAGAGKVRMPAELEALLRTFASGQGINVARLREVCRAVFAEPNASEGRK